MTSKANSSDHCELRNSGPPMEIVSPGFRPNPTKPVFPPTAESLLSAERSFPETDASGSRSVPERKWRGQSTAARCAGNRLYVSPVSNGVSQVNTQRNDNCELRNKRRGGRGEATECVSGDFRRNHPRTECSPRRRAHGAFRLSLQSSSAILECRKRTAALFRQPERPGAWLPRDAFMYDLPRSLRRDFPAAEERLERVAHPPGVGGHGALAVIS